MRIGIIGAGNIGATLARHLVAVGHEVLIANSRGPQTLREIEASTGAKATPVEQVGASVQALILSVPERSVPSLPPSIFAQASFVVDTNNYYPWRDGHIAALDEGLADSVWVERHVRRPVIKVFNSIQSNSLTRYQRPPGSADRIALPISGDDGRALERTAQLVDAIGFEPVMAGDLESSWRQQPGSPAYCTDVGAAELQRLLPLADRERLPDLRDAAIREFMATNPPPTAEQRRDIFRRLYLPI